jgi:hypothetical protein
MRDVPHVVGRRLEGEMTGPVPSLQNRPLVAGPRRTTLIGSVALVGAGSVLDVIGFAFNEANAGAAEGRRRSGTMTRRGRRDAPQRSLYARHEQSGRW